MVGRSPNGGTVGRADSGRVERRPDSGTDHPVESSSLTTMDRETQRLWALPGLLLMIVFGLIAVASIVLVLSDAFSG